MRTDRTGGEVIFLFFGIVFLILLLTIDTIDTILVQRDERQRIVTDKKVVTVKFISTKLGVLFPDKVKQNPVGATSRSHDDKTGKCMYVCVCMIITCFESDRYDLRVLCKKNSSRSSWSSLFFFFLVRGDMAECFFVIC